MRYVGEAVTDGGKMLCNFQKKKLLPSLFPRIVLKCRQAAARHAVLAVFQRDPV